MAPPLEVVGVLGAIFSVMFHQQHHGENFANLLLQLRMLRHLFVNGRVLATSVSFEKVFGQFSNKIIPLLVGHDTARTSMEGKSDKGPGKTG